MIREFEYSDTDKIMPIWLEENISAHKFISKEYWENHFEYVKSALPDAKIYVYTKNDEICGFIGMNGNYIEGIFVKSDKQHIGIGTALLNKVKQENSQLTLNVYKKNVKAFGFYLKSGFEIIEEKDDTETGEKEYTMMWTNEL